MKLRGLIIALLLTANSYAAEDQIEAHASPLSPPLVESTSPASEPHLTSTPQEQPLLESSSDLPSDLQEERAVRISFSQVFAASPLIYSSLLLMSIGSLCVWLYSLLSMRSSVILPHSVLKNLQNKLYSNQYEEVLSICGIEESFFCKMLASAVLCRRYGLPVMLETMKAEGKRASVSLWQKVALLGDIAIMAPMVGLLGTVLGMFYAFYDLNRSMESIGTLFDGLGVSVGTTVVGLLVALIAMFLQSTIKYRLVKLLSHVENEAHAFVSIIDNHTPAR